MTGSWTVEVDRDLCIGSGMCVEYAPATFDQDDHAKSFVKHTSNDSIDVITTAVDACPTRALRLTTDQEQGASS